MRIRPGFDHDGENFFDGPILSFRNLSGFPLLEEVDVFSPSRVGFPFPRSPHPPLFLGFFKKQPLRKPIFPGLPFSGERF